MKNSKLLAVSLIGVIVLLSGCSSKNTRSLISNYAEVSATTQTNLLNTYEDAIYQEQQLLYYKAVRYGTTLKELDPKKIEYSGQQKALKDLVMFTQALAKISSDKYLDDIDKSSEELYSSAKSLSENDYIKNEVEVSKDNIQLFTTILNASTKGYVEYIKTQKLEELMLASSDVVGSILRNLDKDLLAWKRHIKKSLKHRKNIQLLILNDPYSYCKAKDRSKECFVLQESLKSKIELYDEVNQIQKRYDNLDNEFKALGDSISLLAKLHKDIIQSIKDDKLDDVSIATLKRNYYRLDELSKSVNKYRKDIKDKN